MIHEFVILLWTLVDIADDDLGSSVEADSCGAQTDCGACQQEKSFGDQSSESITSRRPSSDQHNFILQPCELTVLDVKPFGLGSFCHDCVTRRECYGTETGDRKAALKGRPKNLYLPV